MILIKTFTHINTRVLVLTALGLLSSCMKSGNQEPIPESIPIQISIFKAAGDTFETGDNVGVFVTNESNELLPNGNHMDNGKFTFDGTTWNVENGLYWLDATTKANFYGYYPYTSSVPSITAFPFNVSKDQRSERSYKASDFMWGKVTGVTPTLNSVNITAEHRMSCLIVNINVGTGWKEEDIQNANVTLCSLRTSSLVNLTDGNITANGNITEIKPFKVSYKTYKAYVVPQTILDTELVKLEIGDKAYILKTTIDLESGKQHTCTIDVKQSNEGINVKIGPWETDDYDYGGTVK